MQPIFMFKITIISVVSKSLSTNKGSAIKNVDSGNSMVDKANVIKASIINKTNTRTFQTEMIKFNKLI